MQGSTWIAISGFTGGILSFAFTVPSGLEYFHVLSTGSAMAGYAIGSFATKHIPSIVFQALVIIAVLAILFASATGYSSAIDDNFSGLQALTVLGLLISTTFFSLSFLMAMAGVTVQSLSKD